MTTPNHTDSRPSPAAPRSFHPTAIASTATFTSLTAALQDNAGTTAAHAVLSLVGRKFIRVVGVVTTDDDSAAGPELRAQYSVDNGSTWAYFNTAAGSGKSLFTGQTGEPGSWNTIPAAAQRDFVRVRVVGFGGDAGASPVIKQLGVEVSG